MTGSIATQAKSLLSEPVLNTSLCVPSCESVAHCQESSAPSVYEIATKRGADVTSAMRMAT